MSGRQRMDPEEPRHPPPIHYPPMARGLYQQPPPPPPLDPDAWRARLAAATPAEQYQAAARYGQRILDTYRPAIDAMAATLGRMLHAYAEALAKMPPLDWDALARALGYDPSPARSIPPDDQGEPEEHER